jgi:Prokaryotic N-terminal methylation motif
VSTRVIRDRLAALRARRDAGISLTELIVSMTLFSIVGAMTLSIFLNINTSAGATVDRTINSSSARNAIEAWSGYLHVADGTTAGIRTNRFEWLAPNDALFYADLFNRTFGSPGTTASPTMIWLRLDSAGSLVEEQFPSSAAFGATPKVCRTLVTGATTESALRAADPSARALFTPYDSHGAVIDNKHGALGTAPTNAAGCQKLPVTVNSQAKSPNVTLQTNLQQVTSIELDFVVSDTTKKHYLEFNTRVVLPTLGGS